MLGAASKDPLAEYVQGTLKSRRTGYDVATYLWEPEGGLAAAKGVVFFCHGLFSHTCFEWLSPDGENRRTLLGGSLIEQVLRNGLAAIAHDHPGHGRTSGMHGYANSFDELRDTAIDVAEAFSVREGVVGKPRFLVGMSMGATTAVQVTRVRPDLFQGFALISPAVRPPDDMFGWYGRFLIAISGPLSWAAPKLPVLPLPSSPDPIIRDAVSKDGLVHRGKLRVRMAMEFLRIYADIDAHADEIAFGKVAVFCGLLDNVVSPVGMKNFVERISCNDKELFVYEKLGHEVVRETGCEKPRMDLLAWIMKRIL